MLEQLMLNHLHPRLMIVRLNSLVIFYQLLIMPTASPHHALFAPGVCQAPPGGGTEAARLGGAPSLPLGPKFLSGAGGGCLKKVTKIRNRVISQFTCISCKRPWKAPSVAILAAHCQTLSHTKQAISCTHRRCVLYTGKNILWARRTPWTNLGTNLLRNLLMNTSDSTRQASSITGFASHTLCTSQVRTCTSFLMTYTTITEATASVSDAYQVLYDGLVFFRISLPVKNKNRVRNRTQQGQHELSG